MLIRNIKDYGDSSLPTTAIYINRQGAIEPVPAPLPLHVNMIDAELNLVRMPGFMDSHVHGIAGADFSDNTETAIDTITAALGQNGVAYCLATFVSMDIPALKARLSALNKQVMQQEENGNPRRARIVGVHLEGPFISSHCKGAHDERVLQKTINVALFKDIISVAPHITNWKITLSPDIEGAIEFIKDTKSLTLNGKSIYVSVFVGHSNAEPELIKKAFEAGAAGFTHLGNACCEQVHRSHHIQMDDITSNVVRFALNHQDGYIELIVDGQHLSDEFVTFVYQQQAKNILLISDSLSPARMPDGDYSLGTLAVTKETTTDSNDRVETIVLKDAWPRKLAGSAAVLPEIVEKYYSILKSNGKTSDECMDAIYQAAVCNPRMSSLPPASRLPDENNFVVLDKTTGRVQIHVCNGQVYLHDDFRSKIDIPFSDEPHRLFSTKSNDPAGPMQLAAPSSFVFTLK